MGKVKLIYFRGCPKAKDAIAMLEGEGIRFETIQQDDLPEGDPMLEYSSPTILKDEKPIYGQHIGSTSSACNIEVLDCVVLRQKLREH